MACLMVTAVLWALDIAQQGSTNNGYLHLSLARIPPHPIFVFSFSSISLWVQGVEEAHSKQYRRYSFILLGRRSPCQRSMARLARITAISISNSFSGNSSWQVGAGSMPSEHYQSCNMKAGDKEGRREERKCS